MLPDRGHDSGEWTRHRLTAGGHTGGSSELVYIVELQKIHQFSIAEKAPTWLY